MICFLNHIIYIVVVLRCATKGRNSNCLFNPAETLHLQEYEETSRVHVTVSICKTKKALTILNINYMIKKSVLLLKMLITSYTFQFKALV